MGEPVTTIPPFNNIDVLPACAAACIPLYDVNGGCVPPAAAQADPGVYTACFCNDARLSPWSSAASGVCDTACPQPAGLTSIQNWYKNICSAGGNGNGNGGNDDGGSTTATDGDSSGGSKGGSNDGGGGDWFSNHWQWVVFLVVMVVAIAGIWIGACIFRRRYLRKRDRQLLGGNGKGPDQGIAMSSTGPSGPNPSVH